MNSFVGNFNALTHGKSLSDMFSEFVRVITSKIVMDFDAGHSPGFAYIPLDNNRSRH